MVNNFFVGDIYFSKRLGKHAHIEKCILYSCDNYNYLDLTSGKWYTSDIFDKNYVIKESVKSTDISEYRENYQYLLDKYNKSTKKRIIN